MQKNLTTRGKIFVKNWISKKFALILGYTLSQNPLRVWKFEIWTNLRQKMIKYVTKVMFDAQTDRQTEHFRTPKERCLPKRQILSLSYLLYINSILQTFIAFFTVIMCSLNPCVHGTCTDTSSGFHCVCSTLYTGIICDTRTDINTELSTW